MKFYALLTASLIALACSKSRASADSANSEASATHDSSRTTPATNDARRRLTPDARRRTILFVGTSITAGYGLEPDSAYPVQIQKLIDDASLPYIVENAGVSGETSADLLRRLDWLMRAPFDVIVIETGANDGLRGIPVEEMQRNIEQVVARVKAARPTARIVLVQMEALPNLGASYTRAFHAVFPTVAKSAKVDLLPFLLDGVAGDPELNQGDGIHPNYRGERIVARNVWKGLRPLLQ